MFGLFSDVSNKQIEKLVQEALDSYEDSFLPGIESLVRFAESKKLGRWKRGRFSVKAQAHMEKSGAPKSVAKVVASAYDLFLSSREPIDGIHAEAFEAGLGGAADVAGGRDLSGASHAGSVLLDEYILNPDRRDTMLTSYRIGWQRLGNHHLTAEMAKAFTTIAAAVAHGTGDLQGEELAAWRRGLITPAAMRRYQKERAQAEKKERKAKKMAAA